MLDAKHTMSAKASRFGNMKILNSLFQRCPAEGCGGLTLGPEFTSECEVSKKSFDTL